MELIKFDNYEQYKNTQEAANHKKLDRVWVSDDEVDAISAYFLSNVQEATFGICHGVRNGWEVRAFKKKLAMHIIGTEISDTASAFKDVIQWDFHKAKPEWVGKVDFVYSNSWDHSYDPQECLKTWLSLLTEEGMCFIQWTKHHNKTGAGGADCFAGTKEEYIDIIEASGTLVDTLEIGDISIFVIRAN